VAYRVGGCQCWNEPLQKNQPNRHQEL
jgi:hypothetical protein